MKDQTTNEPTLGDMLAKIYGRREGPIPYKWDRNGAFVVNTRHIFGSAGVQRQMDAGVRLGDTGRESRDAEDQGG